MHGCIAGRWMIQMQSDLRFQAGSKIMTWPVQVLIKDDVTAIHHLGWWIEGASFGSISSETDRTIPLRVTRLHARTPTHVPLCLPPRPHAQPHELLAPAPSPTRAYVLCFPFVAVLATACTIWLPAHLNSTAQFEEPWIFPHCSALLSEHSTTQTNSIFYTRVTKLVHNKDSTVGWWWYKWLTKP
jgi:hypothetical protein